MAVADFALTATATPALDAVDFELGAAAPGVLTGTGGIGDIGGTADIDVNIGVPASGGIGDIGGTAAITAKVPLTGTGGVGDISGTPTIRPLARMTGTGGIGDLGGTNTILVPIPAAFSFAGIDVPLESLQRSGRLLGQVRPAFSGKPRMSITATTPFAKSYEVTTATLSKADAATLEAEARAPGPKAITGTRFDSSTPMLVRSIAKREIGEDGGEVVITLGLEQVSP